MCGIITYFGEESEQSIQEHMRQSITQRGEISEAYSAENVEIFVRRLQIVDGEHAIQPFFNADRSMCIAYNGEIFNFAELRQNLEHKYSFSSNSDTETLLYLWQEYAEKCLEMLHGQFAFVIYNFKEQSFVAVRDRLGVSPLYYVQMPKGIFFASTIASLVPICETKNQIKYLEPGSYYHSQTGIHKYFDLNLALKPSPKTKEQQIEYLRKTLCSAIEMRVDTHLPIGVIYSGGLDSSIVLEVARQCHPDVTAFTIGRPGCEDFEISKRFCRERQIKQVIISLQGKELNRKTIQRTIALSELSEYLDIINAVISLPLFAEIHKHGIKVVLSGDGSDELFAGYDMYGKIADEQVEELFLWKLQNLHRTELQRVDRAAGAYCVENRVPFLDKEMIKLALGMPKDLKLNSNIEKWCLRKAFANDLPEYILNRKKNPLSHSSGLHEKVRAQKLLFQAYYKHLQYDKHCKLRRDFSVNLQQNQYNIEKSMSASELNADYSLSHKLLEMAKGLLRYHFASTARKAKQRCIAGKL